MRVQQLPREVAGASKRTRLASRRDCPDDRGPRRRRTLRPGKRAVPRERRDQVEPDRVGLDHVARARWSGTGTARRRAEPRDGPGRRVRRGQCHRRRAAAVPRRASGRSVVLDGRGGRRRGVQRARRALPGAAGRAPDPVQRIAGGDRGWPGEGRRHRGRRGHGRGHAGRAGERWPVRAVHRRRGHGPRRLAARAAAGSRGHRRS